MGNGSSVAAPKTTVDVQPSTPADEKKEAAPQVAEVKKALQPSTASGLRFQSDTGSLK